MQPSYLCNTVPIVQGNRAKSNGPDVNCSADLEPRNIADADHLELLICCCGRERSNDFFEARVVSKRVPARVQTKRAVVQLTGQSGSPS